MSVNVEEYLRRYNLVEENYREFMEGLDDLIHDLNMESLGGLEGEGWKWWEDLLNLQTVFNGVGRFFPDEEGLKTLFEEDAKASKTP